MGPSATQPNLAANSVQIGFGAFGYVAHNHIAGNEWLGESDTVATAVLVYLADETTIRQNNIFGNAEVALYIGSDGAVVDNNRVFERDADQAVHLGGTVKYDIGLGDYGSGNSFTNNKVRGYDSPADAYPDDGEITGTKVVPSPHDPGAACFLPDSSAQAC